MRGFAWGGAGEAGAVVLPMVVFFILDAVWPPQVLWQWIGEGCVALIGGACLQWALLKMYHRLVDARDS